MVLAFGPWITQVLNYIYLCNISGLADHIDSLDQWKKGTTRNNTKKDWMEKGIFVISLMVMNGPMVLMEQGEETQLTSQYSVEITWN